MTPEPISTVKMPSLETLEDFKKAIVALGFSADMLKAAAENPDTSLENLKENVLHFRREFDTIIEDAKRRDQVFSFAILFHSGRN